jgi:thiosulfate/3-mercaptopyruvate sulfurtransferase
MADYAHPESLVTTDWVASNLDNPKVRLIEVDVDTAAHDVGHAPGAVAWNWKHDLETQVTRDVPDKVSMERLLADAGVNSDTTIVLYGDNNNWFAAYALWLLRYYGLDDAKLMNGGRQKWIEENRPLTTAVTSHPKGNRTVTTPRADIRATRREVLERIGKPDVELVDVRSPEEFSGELLAPENLPQEGSQRGGHIPGAKNIVWSRATNADGTFKSAEELEKLYAGEGVTRDKEVITYCRIGERSAHTWFVLKELLGFKSVRNYDGSWTEWGSLVGVPVER